MKIENYIDALNASNVSDFIKAFSSGCSRCSLAQHDNKIVIARGNPNANIMLIGEAPGAKEDQCGRPFSGPAGQLLDKIFNAININTNEDMFITNVVYCRPVAAPSSGKQNYTPKLDQICRCIGFTNHLIEVINPKIIIACGGSALKSLAGDVTIKITEWEGKWTTHKTGRPIFCILHPAAVLHKEDYPDEQKEMKMKIWGYMQEFRDNYRSRL